MVIETVKTKKKRVLILANNDVGLYNFRKDLIIELINRGNEVFISLPYGKRVEDLKNIGCFFINTDIERRNKNPFKDFILFIKYFLNIIKIKPDLILTYTIKPNIYGCMAARLLNKQYAANITGIGTIFQEKSLLLFLLIKLYKFSLKKAKVVFFENSDNKKLFIERKIVSEEKAFVLNGAGVNLEEYSFCEYPPDGTVRFLFIGRIMKEKGIDEFLYAAKTITPLYNAEFHIVGHFEEDYKSIFEDYEKQGIIKYHGFLEDVKPVIKQSHCFVLPSHHEGMANTLLECAAMGRPLITSNIPGCKEAVEDGVNGYLHEVMNKEDICTKIIKFIGMSCDNRINMGIESRKHIETYFDKKDIVNKTLGRIIESSN